MTVMNETKMEHSGLCTCHEVHYLTLCHCIEKFFEHDCLMYVTEWGTCCLLLYMLLAMFYHALYRGTLSQWFQWSNCHILSHLVKPLDMEILDLQPDQFHEHGVLSHRCTLILFCSFLICNAIWCWGWCKRFLFKQRC